MSPAGADDELGGRLRAALQADADAVRYDEEAGLDAVRKGGRIARRRRRAALAGAGIAALIVAAVANPLAHDDDKNRTVTTGSEPALSTSASDPPTTSPPPSAPDASTGPRPSTTPPSSTTTSPPETTPPEDGGDTPTASSRPPLWPFRATTEVDEWRASYLADGSGAWHLDAEQTALAFTTDYLGFTEINRVVRSDIGATEAHVTVGFARSGVSGPTAAANIHLLRWGRGDDAPWGVVGTADEALILDTPRYGSTVTSPMTVGGEVRGIDATLYLRVLQPSSSEPLGQICCKLADDRNPRWSVSVPFSGATDPALTVVVSTGGTVRNVERFAITAVRT